MRKEETGFAARRGRGKGRRALDRDMRGMKKPSPGTCYRVPGLGPYVEIYEKSYCRPPPRA